MARLAFALDPATEDRLLADVVEHGHVIVARLVTSRDVLESLDVLAPDVVLVPLVYGDRFGTRIGHGKGHYDRALDHLRQGGTVYTIGIAWEAQISEEPIPADPWDVPLDAIATPAGWMEFR